MKNKNKIFIIIIIIFIMLISILIINNILNKKGELIELNYSQVQEKINNKDSFILIVSQSTCSHCASYKNELKKVIKEYTINIYYIDYDKETENNKTEFLNSFNLDGSTPITLFINDGKETSLLNRIEGETNKKNAITKFKKMGFIE